jgi:hypothetical protein
MDQLSNLVRRVRGNSSYAKRDRDAERPPRPLQVEMHEAQPEPEVEAAAEDEVGDDMPEFRNPFEGQPDPEVFLGGPSDKFVFTKYEGHIVRCITTML